MERHKMRRFTDKLLEDPGFTTRFLDFLGEYLTVDGPDSRRVAVRNVVVPKSLTFIRLETT